MCEALFLEKGWQKEGELKKKREREMKVREKEGGRGGRRNIASKQVSSTVRDNRYLTFLCALCMETVTFCNYTFQYRFRVVIDYVSLRFQSLPNCLFHLNN